MHRNEFYNIPFSASILILNPLNPPTFFITLASVRSLLFSSCNEEEKNFRCNSLPLAVIKVGMAVPHNRLPIIVEFEYIPSRTSI